MLKPSVIKPVIATLEQALVIKTLGQLSQRDQVALKTGPTPTLKTQFDLAIPTVLPTLNVVLARQLEDEDMSTSRSLYGRWKCVASMILLCNGLLGCGEENQGLTSGSSSSSSSMINQPQDQAPWIQWIDSPGLSADGTASGLVSLRTFVGWTTTGIEKVEFLIDGRVSAELGETAGAKQPGAPLFLFYLIWDTSRYSDGPHTVMARVTDRIGRTADTPTLMAIVKNQITMAPMLSGATTDDIGHFSVNLTTGEITGEVLSKQTGVVGVHIHDGYAGTAGEQLVELRQDSPGSGRWVVPVNTVLTPDQTDRLLRGALYVDLDSTVFPDGEIRAQIK